MGFFEFYNRLYTKRKDTEVFNIFYLKIMKKDGSELFCEKGDKISAVYAGEYSEGDKIILHCNEGSFVKMQLDEALKESMRLSDSLYFRPMQCKNRYALFPTPEAR